LLFAVTLCGVFMKVAFSAVDRAQDRAQLLQLERDWNHVYLVNDPAPLQHIIADDYLGTEPDGRRVTKKDLIADVKGPSEFSSSKVNEDDITVRFYGDTGIVNGSTDWVQKNGKAGRWIWTDIAVKKNDRWQVVASQDLEAAAK
jgi:uncharacterized protein DUF4440